MTKPLLAALAREPLARPPVWIMRQAGRHLPEYRELRAGHSFQESVSTPSLAAEITLQPIRRYGLDGAVIFADIMTPLEAMGIGMTFDPGPKLRPHTLAEVAGLPDFDPNRCEFVAETIHRVRGAVPDDVAVIGFAGGPLTLLAYLVEGGGSKDFMGLRGALWADPPAARDALARLAAAMNAYLSMQIEAGAEVVQLFDTWAGLLGPASYTDWAGDPAAVALGGLGAPTIYFAPGAGHVLEQQAQVGATGYGVDWRLLLPAAWAALGDVAVQGNLDPAVLLAEPDVIRAETRALLQSVAGRPGHILNLGHGLDRRTPPENVATMVDTARQWNRDT